MEFNQLVHQLNNTHLQLTEQAIKAVNTSLTIRNWLFGFYIVEFEQNGEDRATYGTNLLATLAKELKRYKLTRCDERELRRCRQFYINYPQFTKVVAQIESIREALTPKFEDSLSIRESATPEFQIPDNHYNTIINKLSYTHLVELLKVEDPLQRLFYEIETLKCGWTVKELKRQIGSLLYERTGLSANKEKLLSQVDNSSQKVEITNIIRDPYVFEFLGLKPREIFTEKALEHALLDHLTQFLLELGKGFCLEAQQKRILIDSEHHFIDLVFYHRLLHCNVLIDLKTERFHHSHAGQLNMYLEYYKRYEMQAGDNPPVGILLCTSKDKEHVEFATAGLDEKLFVAQYLVGLPDKKELELFIRKEIQHREIE